MNAAAIVVSRTSRRQPITSLLRQLVWRIEFQNLGLSYKALISTAAPGYLQDIFIGRIPSRNMQSHSFHDLFAPPSIAEMW